MPDTALEPNLLIGERVGGSHHEAASGSPDDQFAGFIPPSPDANKKGEQQTSQAIEQQTQQQTSHQQTASAAKSTSSNGTEFDPAKLSGQKRRWYDEEIKPHYETLAQKAARVAELEAAIAERENKIKEYEPFQKRVAELEPLTSELEGLKKKLAGYDETLVKGFTPSYSAASDPEVMEMERVYRETRAAKIASLIKSDLLDVNDPSSQELAAADAKKLNAEHDALLKFVHDTKNDVQSVLAAQVQLKKAGYLDPAAVWGAAQSLLRERLAIGKKIQERQAGHVQEAEKGWTGRRDTISQMVQKRFTTPVEILDKKIADGVELTDDEVWTVAARLLPEAERVPLMQEAIAEAQEIYAGAKPVSREELQKNPELLQQLVIREKNVRGKIAPTLLQGTTSKLQTRVLRALLAENKKLQARAGDRAAATKIERDAGGAGGAQSENGGAAQQTMSAEEAEAAKEKAFAKI